MSLFVRFNHHRRPIPFWPIRRRQFPRRRLMRMRMRIVGCFLVCFVFFFHSISFLLLFFFFFLRGTVEARWGWGVGEDWWKEHHLKHPSFVFVFCFFWYFILRRRTAIRRGEIDQSKVPKEADVRKKKQKNRLRPARRLIKPRAII